jgi:hypothetical protein
MPNGLCLLRRVKPTRCSARPSPRLHRTFADSHNPCSPSHSRHVTSRPTPPHHTTPASLVLLCSAHCPHLDLTRPNPTRSTTPRCARRRGARRPRPPTGRPRARPRRRPPPSPGTPAHRHHHAGPWPAFLLLVACLPTGSGLARFLPAAVIRTGEISIFCCRVRSTCNCCWMGWVRLGCWLNPKDAT